MKYLDEIDSNHMFTTTNHPQINTQDHDYGEDKSNFYMTQPLSPLDGKIPSDMMASYYAQNSLPSSKG